MFASRYFTPKFFARRYFPASGIRVGNILWLTFRAKKGYLESVFIQKVITVLNERTYLHPVIFYKDNLNAIYTEDDLCSRSTALLLIAEYELTN